MTSRDCHDFRVGLSRHLAGGSADLTPLGWHAHLLGCADCHALLEREQALELLLDGLPEPVLPPELVARVLARLRESVGDRPARARDEVLADGALWELLEHDAAPRTPTDLSRRVLDGVRVERALDALLDEALAVPPADGLAGRVLAGVHASEDADAVPTGRLLRGPWGRRLALAAGVLVLGLLGWRVLDRGPRVPGGSSDDGVAEGPVLPTVDGAPANQDLPEDELLVWLDVLDRMEVMDEVAPVELDLVTALDPSDELLLEWLEAAELDGAVLDGEEDR